MRYRLRTLLILLAVVPPLVGSVVVSVKRALDAMDRSVIIKMPPPKRPPLPDLPPGHRWVERLTDEELEKIKARSAELGAPQPVPLPPDET